MPPTATDIQRNAPLDVEKISKVAKITQSKDKVTVYDNECELWADLEVSAWKNSVMDPDGVFYELYEDTRRRVTEACDTGKYDVLVEVGCGTGEIISHLNGSKANVPRIGVDINPDFIDHCKTAYAHEQDLEFYVHDASDLHNWWVSSGFHQKYKSPLMVCPNNTLMIMPEGIREVVLKDMQLVAGATGRCLVTFWNGKLFAHGVMGFYKKNAPLCGDFNLAEDVQWDINTIETKTSYKSEWLTADVIVRWMNSLLIQVDLIDAETVKTPDMDHVCEFGMGVYLWLQGTVAPEKDATVTARDYYDSKDAQTFYYNVWGDHNTHIGRYDLVEADQFLSKLPLADKIREAQLQQELQMMASINKHYQGAKVRCLDMGCGYGGFLRSMAANGVLWSGVGVDISGEMIEVSKRQTEKASPEVKSLVSFQRESYMNTSVQDEGVDLCISMDAFLHVGPGQHDNVLKEAWRVLRPGGRLIFTDIVARSDAPPDEARILYERLGLTAFATVEGYFQKASNYGFGEFEFEDHSSNVAAHYGNVGKVFDDLWKKGNMHVSDDFKEKMSSGLEKWRDLAPSCLQWGVISMRKLEQLSSDEETE
jgi:sarcosine/dimethylglycine N-methyltransferase